MCEGLHKSRQEVEYIGFLDLLMIAVGLSMDAFAVSVCKGMEMKGDCKKAGIIAGIYFGGFQAVMPMIGYCLGNGINQYITSSSRYVALVLLAVIGAGMILEAVEKQHCEPASASLKPSIMLPAAIATSIDAVAVGVTFAAQQVVIFSSITVIGITTFLISFAGVRMGNVFGNRFGKQAQILGGIILICIGIKIFAVS